MNIDRNTSLTIDGLLGYAVKPGRYPSSIGFLARVCSVVTVAAKAVLLFTGLLALVTAAAAVIGCLFLSNGDIAYLTDPEKLFHFVYAVRAGLKVNIVFVTFLLFFFCINENMLTRPWWSGGRNAALRSW